jgi:cyclophilin family peptidyl-prolyl cis-trans isomerase
MANEGSPNTNGSQFWFCPAQNCTLHKKFVVFGMLESGFEVLEKIENVKTLASVPLAYEKRQWILNPGGLQGGVSPPGNFQILNP